jgi:TolB-like protein/Tfp pilus assembly protein PilF
MMSLFDELKRRNVFRVGIAYVLMGWMLLQGGDFALDLISAPIWVIQALSIVMVIGLPVALFFAWAFEMTPEGIKKESQVDRSQSITPRTGRKLDILIIGVLVVTVGYLLFDKFGGETTEPEMVREATMAPETGVGELRETGDRAIAVLPFANRSRNEDDEFFAEGMHDDLLTQLAKINDLKVVSRTTAMKYKDTALSIPEIAAELGVGIILEGGVQRAGDRVRINAQLIDVATDDHLWSETFDREMTVENLFDIQSEITRQIVSAVRGELTEEETAALASLPTDSIEAYEAFLKARSYMERGEYDRDNYTSALPFNERALEFDPEFASAWAQQVEIRGQMVWMGQDDSPEQLALVQHALDNANRYGLGNADVMAAQGAVYYRIDNDYAAATLTYESAVKLLPGDAALWQSLAFAQRRTGNFEGAIASLEKSLELDPDNAQSRQTLVSTHWFARNYEQARTLATRWLELEPDAAYLRRRLIDVILRVDGNLEEARNQLERMGPQASQSYVSSFMNIHYVDRDYDRMLALFENPDFSEWFMQPGWREGVATIKAKLHYLKGDTETSERLNRQALALYESANPTTPSQMASDKVSMAAIYMQLGDVERALAMLTEAEQLHPPHRAWLDWAEMAGDVAWVRAKAGQTDAALSVLELELSRPGTITRWDLHTDQLWDFMRDDPRFVAIVTPNNLRDGKE